MSCSKMVDDEKPSCESFERALDYYKTSVLVQHQSDYLKIL